MLVPNTNTKARLLYYGKLSFGWLVFFRVREDLRGDALAHTGC